MKKVMFFILVAVMATNLYAQKKIDVKNVCCKADTLMVFSMTDKDLSAEFGKLNKFFGEPTSCKAGEIIWENIEISGVGKDLQIKLVDGIQRMKNGNEKFRKFSGTKNKNCGLKCLEANQQRQINITIMDGKDKNIIINNTLKDASLKYLEAIIQ